MADPLSLTLHENHPRRFASASLVLARTLTGLETDAERKARKHRVLQLRLRACEEALADGTTIDLAALKAAADGTRDEAATIVVDLAFSVPFAPYELTVDEADFSRALHTTAAEMNFGRPFVDRVLTLKKETAASQAPSFFSSPWTVITAASLLTAAAIPLLPALIGGAGGLVGAAATSHGLALLGGGSLAVGGFGVAGGTWVLATLGVGAAGMSAAGASGVLTLVRDAPPEVIRMEVAKCQTTTMLRMENGSWTRDDVTTRLHGLDEVLAEIQKDLNREKDLNDPSSSRIRNLEQKLKALRVGHAWIAERLG